MHVELIIIVDDGKN